MAATFFNDRQSVLFSSTALCNSYGFEFCLPCVFSLCSFVQFFLFHLHVLLKIKFNSVDYICLFSIGTSNRFAQMIISALDYRVWTTHFWESHSDLRISFCSFGFSRRRMRAQALLVVWSSRIRSNQADSDPSAWVEVPVWVFVGERCVCCWLSTIFRRRIGEENNVAEPELSDEELSWSRSSSFALCVDRRFLVPRW